MKYIGIIILLGLSVTNSSFAQAPKKIYIVVTKTYKMADGLEAPEGEVELVIKSDEYSYTIWIPDSESYLLPKQHARVISSEEAAIRLIKQRQELYNGLAENSDEAEEPNPADNLKQMQEAVKLLQMIQSLDQAQQNQIFQLLKLKEAQNR